MLALMEGSCCVDEVLVHGSVVGWCVVSCEVICEVKMSRSPIHMELLLVDTVVYPIKMHVNGAGPMLCDSVIG